MATAYIGRKTSKLYTTDHDGAQEMVLIFGDEVDTTGAPTPPDAEPARQRTPVTFRGRPGFIKTPHLTQNPGLELYFIDVGQGDSTFIVTPARRKILVDGGANNRALGFLAWKYRLDRDDTPPVTIDLMVVSHADEDHLKGLTAILSHPKINVGRVVHNGIALFRGGTFDQRCGDLDPDEEFLVTLHDAADDFDENDFAGGFRNWIAAVKAENTRYGRASFGDGAIDIDDPDITLEIAAPLMDELDGDPVFRWFGNHAHTINGHSLALRLNYGANRLFLSGDLNIEGSQHLLGHGGARALLDAHILKSPHHGSHEFYLPLLEAVNPQISVISSGDSPDHGHPRAVFLGAVGAASRSPEPLIFSTEIAASFQEVKSDDDPTDEAALEDLDPSAADVNVRARRLFKRRLHGMINVRATADRMFAARRVAAGYWWESYGPVNPAPRSDA
jgi:beta-lactamase superfamily II metal-dependent hydrolase